MKKNEEKTKTKTKNYERKEKMNGKKIYLVHFVTLIECSFGHCCCPKVQSVFIVFSIHTNLEIRQMSECRFQMQSKIRE